MVKRRIVPRSEWGAQHGRGVPVHGNLPWGEVVFHTEAGAVRPQDWRALASFDHDALNAAVREIGKMRAVEHFHAVTLGWLGFGYSFYIAYDGTVFEGRGWGYQGSHTETRNATAAGVCFEGHGDLERLTPEQIESARWLVAEGKRLGKLTRNVKISGHRDYSRKGKTCPGLLVYPIIQTLGQPPQSESNPTGGLSMADINDIIKRLDRIEKGMARKATAYRDPRDNKVWVVGQDGRRYHLPNKGNMPVNVMTFLGVLAPNSKVANVHPIAAEHLDAFPKADG